MNGNAEDGHLNAANPAELPMLQPDGVRGSNGLGNQTSEKSITQPKVHVDVLIVGTGPAGLSLACFLAYHGIKGLVIGMQPSTARTPRAHYTNSAALECFRDIGLEDEVRRVGVSRDHYQYYRFVESMTGEEYIRAHGFNSDPKRRGEYVESSPCEHCDVPQNVLEPVLLKYATQHGFKARFDSKLLSFKENESTGLVTSTIYDKVTEQEYQIISKYLCGADGANSVVVNQLGLEISDKSTGGFAINAWYEADLSHIGAHSPGLLHTCFTPHIDGPPWGIAGINRFIRPWNEWLMVILSVPGLTGMEPSDAEILARTREFIGDDSIEIKLKGVSKWYIKEAYAHTYSKGHVFGLGDAVHRHPPGNGLGSNTCVQDAYNLAWKLAYVLKAKASSSLLDTYSPERQPIGKRVVQIANHAFDRHFALYGAMGLLYPTAAERMAALQELKMNTPEAAERRRAVKTAHEGMDDEREGLGAEMNQAYESSAVYTKDETTAISKWWEGPDSLSEGIRHHIPSTEPGARLPHAWLKTSRLGHRLSTHDLAGKGRFTIFTGIGGTAIWKTAAADLTAELGVEIQTYTIGWGQEYGDLFWMWEERRGVSEDGCVLVRPDRTVAWRCNSATAANVKSKLATVLKSILGL